MLNVNIIYPTNITVTAYNPANDEIEYEEDDEEYDDEDYYPPDRVNGDLESKSSKVDKTEKIVKLDKVEKKPQRTTTERTTTTTTTTPAPKTTPTTTTSSTTASTTTATTASTTPRSIKNYHRTDSARNFSQNSPTQKQQSAVANPSIKYRLTQTQNGKTQIYPISSTTERIPDGFKGKVEEKKYQTRFLPSKHVNSTEDKGTKKPDTYVTVTKSVSGSLDNSKKPPEDNKFESTYYTKSSTCGYFTFSCNIVYGSNGRSKICRPKAPTNGKC